MGFWRWKYLHGRIPHTYIRFGPEYTVTLTAIGETNLSTALSQTIDIQAPVTAAFTFEVDPNDYRTYSFTDASEDAVMKLVWLAARNVVEKWRSYFRQKIFKRDRKRCILGYAKKSHFYIGSSFYYFLFCISTALSK